MLYIKYKILSKIMVFSLSCDKDKNITNCEHNWLLHFSDAYKYGYDINPHGQFHHETRGPHGITYGCYGYVDPFGHLKATFYISDGWGYRVVQPGKDVELFLHKHEHHQNGDNHDHHEHHGVITPWRELYFPAVCAQYINTNVPPLVIPSAGST